MDARPDLILGDQDAYRLGISAKSISSPNSVVGGFLEATPSLDNQSKLWIPNSRDVRRYSADETKPIVTIKTKFGKKNKPGIVIIKGKASDDYTVLKVEYSINNGALKAVQGVNVWKLRTKLKLGKNKVNVFAADSVGNVSVTSSIIIMTKK